MRTLEKPEVLSAVVTIVAALIIIWFVSSIFEYVLKNLVVAVLLGLGVAGALAYIGYKNRDER